MKVITALRKKFWLQIVLRGAIQSGVILVILTLVTVLTRKELHNVRLGIPAAEPLSEWLSQASSWDLFAYIFIFTTLFHYVGQLGGVVADRYNLTKLANWSRADLASGEPPETSADEMAESEAGTVAGTVAGSVAGAASGPGAARANKVFATVLTLRRRTLQGVLRSDPNFIATLTLVVFLGALGHYVASGVLLLFSIFTMGYMPIMIMLFRKAALRAVTAMNAAAMQEPQGKEHSAEKAINRVEARLATLVNRPLIRLQVGWPVLVGAIACVSIVAFVEINYMGHHGLLPASSVLLVAILAVVARNSLALARDCEDTAFFASNTQGLEHGQFDQEIL